jgi:hypothetical protein
VEGLNQEERSRLIRSVGTHRGVRPLSPIEVARLLAKALEHSTPDAVAEEVEFRGTTMVTRFVRLLDLPEEFQPLVDWGQSSGGIPFSAATAVGGLSQETQRTLLNLILSGELDPRDLKQVVPILRMGHTVSDAISEAGKLRPVVVRRHLLIGAVAISQRERIASLDQDQRESVLRSAIADLLPSRDLVTARLLPERFAIITNDSGKASIDSKAASVGLTFERLIQARIQGALESLDR